MVSWHGTARVKYVWGLQAAHSILVAAIAFMVSIISKASIASRPISILFGSMVSCHVGDISKYVWGLHSVHSILMAAIVIIVSLIIIATTVSKPISF